MIGSLNLPIFDVFEYVSFFALFEEGELFGPLLGVFAFHLLEFFFVDFPVAFEFFVEADLVGDGDGAEHCVIDLDLEAGLYSQIIFLLYLITPYYVLIIILFSFIILAHTENYFDLYFSFIFF